MVLPKLAEVPATARDTGEVVGVALGDAVESLAAIASAQEAAAFAALVSVPKDAILFQPEGKQYLAVWEDMLKAYLP